TERATSPASTPEGAVTGASSHTALPLHGVSERAHVSVAATRRSRSQAYVRSNPRCPVTARLPCTSLRPDRWLLTRRRPFAPHRRAGPAPGGARCLGAVPRGSLRIAT